MGRQLTVISYSEIASYRQCPLAHALGYKQRWKKPAEDGSPLRVGTLWHLILEAHYRAIIAYDATHKGGPWLAGPRRQAAAIAVRATLQEAEASDEDKGLIEWMYKGHLSKWDVDESWQVFAAEVPFEVPLPKPNGQRSTFRIKGKIDLIVKDRENGGIWIVDHKSGKNKPNDFELQLDDQFALYEWAIRQLGYKVDGSIQNYARTTRNTADFDGYEGKLKAQTLDQRFERYYYHRSERELKAIADDAYAVAANAYPPASRALPLYSSPDIRQCGWKCDFREVHMALRDGQNLEHVMKMEGFVQDFTRH